MIVKQEQAKGLSFLGLSQQGESHKKSGKPNQDAVEFFALDDFFMLAVSDGLGSCAQSHIGAHTATTICKQVILEILDERLPFASQSITRRLTELWNQQFPPIISRDYSSTLKAVLGNQSEIFAVSIGDGILIVLSGDEVICSASSESGFANETSCLSNDMKQTVFWTGRIARRDSCTIFLSTDGVSSGITEGREIEFVREVAAIRKNEKLKNSLQKMLFEISKYNADDKTLGIVKCEQQSMEN